MIEYNTDDTRELVKQLKEHRPKIKITIEEDFKGDWQLHPNFVVPDNFDAFINEIHGFTNDEHETDCGQYENFDCEFDETKPVYGNSFYWTGIGYYDLDTYISHIEYFIEKGGYIDPYTPDDEPDFSIDGFHDQIDDMIDEDVIGEITTAEAVEGNSNIESISLQMGYGSFPNCIGWQGIHELSNRDIKFEIL